MKSICIMGQNKRAAPPSCKMALTGVLPGKMVKFSEQIIRISQHCFESVEFANILKL